MTSKPPLLPDKNLLKVYIKYRSLPRNNFNFYFQTTGMLCFFLIFFFFNILNNDEDKILELKKDIFLNGILFSSSIIGMLIAGIAVLSSLSNPKIVKFLREKNKPGTSIDFHTITIINSIGPTIVILFFLFTSSILYILSLFFDPIIAMVEYEEFFYVKKTIKIIEFFSILLWVYCFFSSLLAIKSFLYNVYSFSTIYGTFIEQSEPK